MTDARSNPRTPLLTHISQFDVDFVIPRIGIDLPLGIDPFLLYKSRNPIFSSLHDMLLGAFNAGMQALRRGDRTTARYLFDLPEVSEVGLGYTAKGKRGSGVGDFLAALIMETLEDSPALMERGVRHIEEMQLVSIGIGPDRISDITANFMKQFLIEYTQKQCALWGIPFQKGVPLSHIYDPERCTWYDDHVDVPISPIDGHPILLVPRRIVRTLPWINYDEYFRMEFSVYLRAKRVRDAMATADHAGELGRLNKAQVISITRSQVERIDHYVRTKEETGSQAQPSLTYLDKGTECVEAEQLRTRLAALVPGAADASRYQRAVLEILNYLFTPELIDGEMEVKTYEGTERRDIIFTNDSDQSFWGYLRTEHSSLLLMFETKNTDALEPSHLNQTATYLGDRLGRLGFIVTRKEAGLAQQRKAFSIYNDSHPRKIILILSDGDLTTMLDMKCRGQNPMRFVQSAYRKFRQTAQ